MSTSSGSKSDNGKGSKDRSKNNRTDFEKGMMKEKGVGKGQNHTRLKDNKKALEGSFNPYGNGQGPDDFIQPLTFCDNANSTYISTDNDITRLNPDISYNLRQAAIPLDTQHRTLFQPLDQDICTDLKNIPTLGNIWFHWIH